ncbi:MAG TPA: hypothetical protein VNI58_09765 [Mariprofundaceae bacterium]|nr:hypothetical protein [Mariprofundaceae bacterium]
MREAAPRFGCRAALLLCCLLLPVVAAAAADAADPATATDGAAADSASAPTAGKGAATSDKSDTTGAATAAGGLSVDARFDKTGDGIVDASDWAQMDEATKLEYARESVAALGEDPDAMLEGRLTRAQRYLEGLRAVYE